MKWPMFDSDHELQLSSRIGGENLLETKFYKLTSISKVYFSVLGLQFCVSGSIGAHVGITLIHE